VPLRNVFVLALFAAAPAMPAGLSIGVIGGAPFNDVTTSGVTSGLQSVVKSTNFTIGPTLQVNLPLNLRFEADALFRPYHVTITGTNLVDDISGQQWRFPLLAQYRFHAPLIAPYLEAGLSFDHLSGISAAAKSAIASGPGALLHQTDAGFVIGGGVDVKLPLVRVSGEIRFTRESEAYIANFSNLNQAEVLIGIHF
jgi:hypothetical protein